MEKKKEAPTPEPWRARREGAFHRERPQGEVGSGEPERIYLSQLPSGAGGAETLHENAGRKAEEASVDHGRMSRIVRV